MDNIIIPDVETPASGIVTQAMVEKRPELELIKPKEATEDEKKILASHDKSVKEKAGQIMVPDLYFWVDYNILEKPIAMTCAFKWRDLQFGEMWKIDELWSRGKRRAYEKKLMAKMVNSLGLIVHFGNLILDKNKNIDPVKAQDEVARRYFLDKLWKARLDAFHKVIRIKVINVVKAKELGLL
jgi:hypothetical protein